MISERLKLRGESERKEESWRKKLKKEGGKKLVI